jgi:hypothetical protein
LGPTHMLVLVSMMWNVEVGSYEACVAGMNTGSRLKAASRMEVPPLTVGAREDRIVRLT